MNRLANRISELKPGYDVVVIGSGYGGGVASSRMSRCGLKVCVLEKGKEFLPGEFPNTLKDAAREMQYNYGSKREGSENGLFEFVVGKQISVFKGCGLGGTSLVNANVSIEPERRVFADECWPAAIRNDVQSFYTGVAFAREMLRPTPYPEGKNGYPVLAKTEAMRKSAEYLKEPFKMLDINVAFENGINHVGVEQKRCVNCGDCVTGCNHSAKNSVAMNYLPDAKNHGAEIYTEIDVSHIERHGDRWVVFFNLCGTGRQKFNDSLLFVRANMVIISGGALGSTEILLRSRKNGLSVSNMIGKKFTGNGDVLGFGYNNDQSIRAVGLGKLAKPAEVAAAGPCITSAIDIRNRPILEEGMTLEEGSVPGAIRSILLPSLIPISRLIGKNTDRGFVDFLKEKWREVISFFRGPYYGAINNTQIYLVMTHDDGGGKMDLAGNNLTISWPEVGKQKIFEKVSKNLVRATKALGGKYVSNPSWTRILNYDLVTVHPLGGCAMADNAADGVVNHKGEVYSGQSGTEVHPGLYVMDGSVIPRPLGTNPLLTITGLAERSCKIIASERKLSYTHDFPGVAARPIVPDRPGIQFTERMAGYFSIGKEDFEEGYNSGKNEGTNIDFILTIKCYDVESFIEDPSHTAALIGTLTCPQLSSRPLTTSEGKFNLFVDTAAGEKRMLYEMKVHTVHDEIFFFKGFKAVKDDKGADLWRDTSTLYVTIYDGSDAAAPVLGTGIMKIEKKDFRKQMGTMKPLNTKGKAEGLKVMAKFGLLFAGNLWQVYSKGIKAI